MQSAVTGDVEMVRVRRIHAQDVVIGLEADVVGRRARLLLEGDAAILAADRLVAEIPGGADGPYAEFNRTVAEATVGAYESGPMGKLGGGPDDVATVIETAIPRRRPRARSASSVGCTIVLAIDS